MRHIKKAILTFALFMFSQIVPAGDVGANSIGDACSSAGMIVKSVNPEAGLLSCREGAWGVPGKNGFGLRRLANSDVMTCDSGLIGRVYFDTAQQSEVICTSAGWIQILGYGSGSSGSGGGEVSGDIYRPLVAFHLHGDGGNGDTLFTDSGPKSLSISSTGNAQISTGWSGAFGGASIALDGTGDYLAAPNNTLFDFGTGDFVVEARFRINLTKTYNTLFSAHYSGQSGGYIFGTNNGKLAVYNGSSWLDSSADIGMNTDYYAAFVQSGGTVYIYLDGVLVGSGPGVDFKRHPSAPIPKIGRFDNRSDMDFDGYIEELRVTVGTDRGYVSSPPATPSAAFPDSNSSAPVNYIDMAYQAGDPTVSDNGRLVTLDSGGYSNIRSTASMSGGKHYIEFKNVAWGGNQSRMVGLANSFWTPPSNGAGGGTINAWGFNAGDGSIYHQGGSTGIGLPGAPPGATIQIAYDATAGKAWFGVNNSWSGDPASGTSPALTGLPSELYAYIYQFNAGDKTRFLPNESDQLYAPPAGFNGLTSCASSTQVFSYTGSIQSFSVPSGCTQLSVKLWGAGGGGRADTSGGAVGGGGGFASGIIDVSSQTDLSVVVGGGGTTGSQISNPGDFGFGGYGGGGRGNYGPNHAASSGGGGGLSGIFSGADSLTFDVAGQARAIIIAGGGGGGGYYGFGGGGGGGTVGVDAPGYAGTATGGTQSAGGIAATDWGLSGTNGSSLMGGSSSIDTPSGLSGGGGGGGYFGGGGGAVEGNGGGGSAFCFPGTVTECTLVAAANGGLVANSSDASYVSGVGTGGAPVVSGGNGLVIITTLP